MHGFICINKPAGPTSFDCIRYLKQRLPQEKIGHAGTLDPAATGLLVLALGNATALLPYVTLQPKVYDFSIRFGVETDTLDGEGKILRENGPVPVSQELTRALAFFLGDIKQVPPLYSALKVAGRRAYSRARKNETFSLKARPIKVYALAMTNFNATDATGSFLLTCSGGTYVRALARDIAAAVKSFGFASRIQRLACGRFTQYNALTLEAMQTAEPLPLISLYDACDDLTRVMVTAEQIEELRFGRGVATAPSENAEIAIAFNDTKECIAVLKKKDGRSYQPIKVFNVLQSTIPRPNF